MIIAVVVHFASKHAFARVQSLTALFSCTVFSIHSQSRVNDPATK